jgi:hypothetical protein
VRRAPGSLSHWPKSELAPSFIVSPFVRFVTVTHWLTGDIGRAAAAGADHAILITGGYYAGALIKKPAAIKEFFVQVSNASPIPVYVKISCAMTRTPDSLQHAVQLPGCHWWHRYDERPRGGYRKVRSEYLRHQADVGTVQRCAWS